MRRRARAGVVTVLLAAATACTGSPAPPGPSPAPAPRARAWTAVELPGGAVPLLVRASGTGLLLAARTGDLASMFRVPASGPGTRRSDSVGVEPVTVEPVTVEPHSVYAPTARWVDVATDGSRVLAVGRASGGAHGLPRWTVWDGTLDRLVERPQPFETFGGPRSGGLAAVGLGREEVLVGTWDDGGPGLDTRLWTHPTLRRWEQVPTAAPLASTASELPQPTAVAWSASGLVVVGSVTELGDASAVSTRAAAWTAPGTTGPWTRHDLPVSSSSARATGVACSTRACWVVGVDGDRPTAWRLAAGAVDRLSLPDVATVADAPPVVAVAGSAPWVALAGRDRTVLVRPGRGEGDAVEGPVGRPLSLATAPGRLALVTATAAGARLWTAPVG